MDITKQIKTLRSLINLKQVPEDVSRELSRQLSLIESRQKDDNVYIGIIGEFSSGKSTLINSLIGADFFVTNSLQGTTTTPTYIKYGSSINIEVKYKNGKNLKYSTSKNRLIEEFLPSYRNKISKQEWLLSSIKGFFHANSYDQTLIDLFEEITTSNDASSVIDAVIVHYPAEVLKNGIVIVDTPGTDSLNPQHTETTKNTIANVCDMAIVMIPSEKPASQTLVNFIDENFSKEIKQRCYYLVTKIELIKRHFERQNHINGISKRLCAMMDLTYEPKVFMAPTLASLEYRNITSPSGILNHLDSAESEMLSKQFERDIIQITDEIVKTKEQAISERISQLVNTLSKYFRTALNEAKATKQQDLITLRKLQTMPLSDFMSKYFHQQDINHIYNTAEAKISNSILDYQNSFKWYVFEQIDYADTKDRVQSTMSQEYVRALGRAKFDACFNVFSESVTWLKNFYESSFEDFKSSFTNTFSISALDFQFTAQVNESWNKKYRLNFDDTNITTTKLFRFFKSLDSVKSQMKEAVEPQIAKAFGKISSHYLKKIKKIDDELRKQLEKVKSLFVKKYEKIIQKRIEEEKRKMDNLSSQISDLESSLKTLESL